MTNLQALQFLDLSTLKPCHLGIVSQLDSSPLQPPLSVLAHLHPRTCRSGPEAWRVPPSPPPKPRRRHMWRGRRGR
uniref:Stv2 n=1 Tax=Arundo donax TaxID=35708 RepID=A0A0A9E4E8_ARUDO